MIALGSSIGLANAQGVPEPVPVQTDVRVGTYIFPMWLRPGTDGHGNENWNEWATLHKVDAPRAVLGFYDGSNPEVNDWQIKWALEAGISWFAFDWYWNAGESRLMGTLEDGFLKSKYQSKMQFCIHWCNHALDWKKDLDFSPEALEEMIEYNAKHYFTRDNYLKIDGRPVFMVWDMDPVILANGGPDAFRANVLPRLNTVCKRYGVGDLFLVLVQNWPHRVGFSTVGDAFTGYSYAGLTTETPVSANTSAPYAEMVDALPPYWAGMHRSARLPFLTSTQSGWDNTPRQAMGHPRLVRQGSTAELFERTLQDGRKQVKPEFPFFLIEAWNEFGEGSYIEPTEQHGFDYLAAIRRVFAPGAAPHTWARPSQAQVESYTSLTPGQIEESKQPPVPLPPLPTPQWHMDVAIDPSTNVPPTIVRQFDFGGSSLPDGVTANSLTVVPATDGSTRFRNEQGKGSLTFNGNFGTASDGLTVEITLRYPDTPVWLAQLLFGLDGAAPLPDSARPFLWKRDDREHVYRLTFNASRTSSGELTSFRLDAPDWPGAEFDLRTVRITRPQPADKP
jgi:hypothetical protein